MSKIQKLKNILNGWGNEIKDELGLLDDSIKSAAERRLIICDNCPVRDGIFCSHEKVGVAEKTFVYFSEVRSKGEPFNGCGCHLRAKSKCVNCQCPLGKW